MNILSAHIKNFGCIPEARLELQDQGLVYVTGVNLDTDAAESNGSGKSTLYKAVTWCLYGQTVDETKGDKVIRHGAKKAEVRVELGDKEPEYTIRRTRSKGKPKLQVLDKSGEPLDLSKDEIQDRINKLIGLDFKSFKNSVLYGQGDAARFASPRTKDSERKDMLHRIMDTEILQSCHEIALERRRDLRKAIEKFEHEQEILEERLTGFDLGKLELQVAHWESEQEKQIEQYRDVATRLLERAKAQREKAEGVDGLERKLEQLIQQQAKALMEEKVFEDEIGSLEARLNSAREESEAVGQELAGLEAKNKQLAEQVVETEKASGDAVELSEMLGQKESEQQGLLEAVAMCETELASLEETLGERRAGLTTANTNLAKEQANAKRYEDELGRLDGDCCPTCTTPLSEGVAAEYISGLHRDHELCEETISKICDVREKLSRQIIESQEAQRKIKKKSHQAQIAFDEMAEHIGGLKASLAAAQDASARLNGLRDELKACKGRSEVLRLAQEESAQRIKDYQDSLDTAKAKEKRRQEANRKRSNEISEIKETLATARAAAESLDELTAQVKLEMDRLQEAVEETNPFTASLDDARIKLNRCEAQLAAISKELKSLARDLAHVEFWVRGFGNEGLPSYILDSVVPYITERTNHYLGTLADGDISMRFDTQRALKSREGVKDEITLWWCIEGNELVPPSGGQQRKMEIATDLALMDLVASREGTQLDLLLLDEVLDGLDREGRSRVIELLAELRRRRGSVFVISHESDLAEEFERVVRVTKQDGCAIVEVVK